MSDPRTLDFRVLRCHWKSVAPNAEMIDVIPAPARPLARTRRLLSSGFHLLRDLRRSGRNSVRIGLPVPRRLLDRLQLRQESAGISMAFGEAPPPASTRPCVKPALLHTNACGDFTLLHRDHWTELRGYPEFDLYSMNIDSLLCFMAHYNGAIEQVLAEPMRIYHIEHATGSGWTPEGAQMLFDRLAAKGIPWLEYEEVLQFASEMERLRTTMVFNKENWGLADFDLPDVTMPS